MIKDVASKFDEVRVVFDRYELKSVKELVEFKGSFRFILKLLTAQEDF